MNYSFAIPFTISSIAFFCADNSGYLYRITTQKSLLIPDRTLIRQRLLQIGKAKEEDYENFRIAQIVLGQACLLVITICILLELVSIQAGLLLFLISVVLIIQFCERNLSNRCLRRRLTLELEFPTVLEMLTLAIGAGESPASALKRIAIRAHGYLAEEFRQVVTEIESGKSLSNAIDEMSKRTSSDSVRRFSDSLIISISRGTPLVETLTHNSHEARSQERVRLLTAAGKSELTMMIPVVFLILPISILFALFPSLASLNLIGG